MTACLNCWPTQFTRQIKHHVCHPNSHAISQACNRLLKHAFERGSGNYHCFFNPWNDILGDPGMTFLQFNQLCLFEKFAAILEHGVNIGERRSKYANVILYQLFSFYIEVYYDPSQNEIVQLKSFVDTDLLDPYIKSITVESLLQ